MNEVEIWFIQPIRGEYVKGCKTRLIQPIRGRFNEADNKKSLIQPILARFSEQTSKEGLFSLFGVDAADSGQIQSIWGRFGLF